MNNYFSRLAKHTGLKIGPRSTANRIAASPPSAFQNALLPEAPLEVEEVKSVDPSRDAFSVRHDAQAQDLASHEAALPGSEGRSVGHGRESAIPPPLDPSDQARPGVTHPPEHETVSLEAGGRQIESAANRSSKSAPPIAHHVIETYVVNDSTASPSTSLAGQMPPPSGAKVEVGGIEAMAERPASQPRSFAPRGRLQTANPAQSPDEPAATKLTASWEDVYEWIQAAPDLMEREGAATGSRGPMPSLELHGMSDLAPPAERGNEPEAQDFQLSIGNISIVVEAPPPPTPAQIVPPVRAVTPPEPKREVSRLSRHYIRVR